MIDADKTVLVATVSELIAQLSPFVQRLIEEAASGSLKPTESQAAFVTDIMISGLRMCGNSKIHMHDV